MIFFFIQRYDWPIFSIRGELLLRLLKHRIIIHIFFSSTTASLVFYSACELSTDYQTLLLTTDALWIPILLILLNLLRDNLSYVILCDVIPCYVILYYVMPCDIMSCYVDFQYHFATERLSLNALCHDESVKSSAIIRNASAAPYRAVCYSARVSPNVDLSLLMEIIIEGWNWERI